MASLAPPTSAPSPPPSSPDHSTHSSNPPPDDLTSLKAALSDLQSKRLHALRLYQEEKSSRLAETARAAKLANQLKQLSTTSQSPNSHSHPTTPPVISTDFFVAEIRSLGLAYGGPSASLTWHCLAMAERLSKAPQVVVVAEPSETVHNPKIESVAQSIPSHEDPKFHHSDELHLLHQRLKRAEETAAAAKRAQQEKEHLIAELKQQLDESTQACQGLVELVKEQEDTIDKLS